MLRVATAPVRHPGIRNSTTGFASYYFAVNQLPGSATVAVQAGVAYAALFERMTGAIVNRLGIEVTTGAAGNARLGLYAHDHATGNPGPLVLDAGAVSTASAGLLETAIADLALPEVLWMVALFDATPTVRTATPVNNDRFGLTNPSIGSVGRSIAGAQSYGPLPASLTPTTYSATAPTLWMRRV